MIFIHAPWWGQSAYSLHHVPDPAHVRGDVSVHPGPWVLPRPALRLTEADEAEESSARSQQPTTTVALAAVRVAASGGGLTSGADLVTGDVPVLGGLALGRVHHLRG